MYDFVLCSICKQKDPKIGELKDYHLNLIYVKLLLHGNRRVLLHMCAHFI